MKREEKILVQEKNKAGKREEKILKFKRRINQGEGRSM